MIGYSELAAAAERIEGKVHRTPVLSSASIDRFAGRSVFFKCENFQKAGSFKIRGAANGVFSLSEQELAGGVATHSSGNFAQALALAASWRGVPANVVMPENSSQAKIDAVFAYGGRIHPCAPKLEAREETLAKVVEQTGATFLHPYDDDRTIAGQGTATMELLDQIEGLEMLIVPVGGGGLIAGAALAAVELAPDLELIGAEPAGADDAFLSLKAGEIIPQKEPRTLCDGLRTSLGQRSYPIIRDHVARIVTVSDDRTVAAMRLIWERMKIVVEPSAAIALAALLSIKDDLTATRIGILLSGGNVQLDKLPF